MAAVTERTALRRFRGRWLWLRRELAYSDRMRVSVMALSMVVLVGYALVHPGQLPQTVMVLPMIVASLWLGPRTLPWFIVFCLLGFSLTLTVQPTINARTVARIVVVFLIGLLMMLTSFRRSRLGVSGPRGESMLVDLRDRIVRQGTLPKLPSDWYVESVTRSAGGTAFAGDFVVASAAEEHADLVVVDVSGKGVEAGTRALLLSGAFGGLVSALPPAEFLPAANGFLLRQDWAEGFASAIHLRLNVRTGDFELRKAGHPPAVWLQASSGTWRVLESDGPVLGVLPDAEFEAVTGTLGPGDALLLYTDGLVESNRRDIGSGIDKLAGRGQRLVTEGFQGGAARIVNAIGAADDDCALVVVHRL